MLVILLYKDVDACMKRLLILLYKDVDACNNFIQGCGCLYEASFNTFIYRSFFTCD